MVESTDEIEELSEVYDVLRQDAKSLIVDLKDGVSMWRLAGRLLLYLSIIGFFLAYLNVFPSSPPGLWKTLALLAALGLGIFGAAAAIWTERRYSMLKRKYDALFRAAGKMT
jgi:hypothetical protein